MILAVAFTTVPGARAARPVATSVRALGQLVASNTGEALDSVAISGATMFAGAPASTLGVQDQGAVFAFGPPGSGWSGTVGESAVLSASDARGGDGLGVFVAVDGQTVVAGTGTAGLGGGRVYVFVRPAGGWSGTVHQAAELTASDGSALRAVAISGPTIVAAGTDPGTGQGALYVFTRPPGGWSGSLHEVAKLTASDGTSGNNLGASLTVTGTTIVAGATLAKVGWDSPGAVYVFVEPATGWASAVHEAAKLTASDLSTNIGLGIPFATSLGSAVGLSGQTVVATDSPGPGVAPAAYVWSAPSAGWSSETESAKLIAPDGTFTSFPFGASKVAISGHAIAVPGHLGAFGSRAAVFVYSEPPTGWSGTLGESAKLQPSNSDPAVATGPVLISGSTVFAGNVGAAAGQTVVGSGPVYEFTEPASGWAGTLSETASLGVTSPRQGAEYVFAEPAAGWSSETQAATLLPSGSPSTVSFTSVAVSGATAVASGSGSAYVFGRPAAGWSGEGEAATLLDGAGATLGDVAIDGQTIAASTTPLVATRGTIDVFAAPSGGWSGQAQPSARLSSSDGAYLGSPAISGRTIVAAGNTGAVYLFTEPPGGWSGNLHESAKLISTVSGHSGTVGIEGRTVVYGGMISGRSIVTEAGAEVFAEPAGGWTGIQRPSATLTAVVYAPGNTYVFSQPSAGWAGTIRPSARFAVQNYPTTLAISSPTIAVASYQDPGKYYDCPCFGGNWLFSIPRTGPTMTFTAAATLPTRTDVSGRVGIALAGATLFAGGEPLPNSIDTALELYDITPPIRQSVVHEGPPTITRSLLKGLATGKPRLTLALHAGAHAPPIQRFTVRLPTGLRMSTNHHRLASAITLHGVAKYKLQRHANRLSILVTYPVAALSLTIRSPVLIEGQTLIAKARQVTRYNRKRSHRKKQTVKLALSVSIVDAAHTRTRLVIRLTFR